MDKGFRAYLEARQENRVNIENCIANQRDLEIHPNFWKDLTAERIATLNEWLRVSERRVKALTGKESLDHNEHQILQSAQRFIAITTA